MNIALPLLGAALAAGSAAGPAEDIDARLRAGDVVALEARGDGSGGAAHMQLLVSAPARAVWEVIVSCEQAFHFVDGLERCEVLEDTGERALVRQVVAQPWPLPTSDFTFESLRYPFERIDVGLVEGNLRELTGRWTFTDHPDGTLVTYVTRVRPSFPVPGFIVRRKLGRGMPDLLACVRYLAGGSVSVEAEQTDRSRCPGPIPPP